MSHAIDPELLPWLPMLPGIVDYSDLESLRAQTSAMVREGQQYTPTNQIGVQDRQIPGPTGAPDVKVRVYCPVGHAAPRPALLYFHSGSFVLGNAEMTDAICLQVAD